MVIFNRIRVLLCKKCCIMFENYLEMWSRIISISLYSNEIEISKPVSSKSIKWFWVRSKMHQTKNKKTIPLQKNQPFMIYNHAFTPIEFFFHFKVLKNPHCLFSASIKNMTRNIEGEKKTNCILWTFRVKNSKWSLFFDSMHVRMCLMPSSSFLKERPANVNFIWIQWDSYDSRTHFWMVWQCSSIPKLKPSPSQGLYNLHVYIQLRKMVNLVL